MAADVKQAVAGSFVAGFRMAMVAVAFLALVGAAASALTIEGKSKVNSPSAKSRRLLRLGRE